MQTPENLSDAAKQWWKKILTAYGELDDAGLLLLQTTLEAWDRMKAAQAKINHEGMTIEDRFGQMKPHPLLAAERDARSQMVAGFKVLKLDMEPTAQYWTGQRKHAN